MDLLTNPFSVLGASARDNRQRLLELAAEKSAHSDPDLCSRARADLTHPRKRLSAEMAWLPGVAPRRVQDLVAAVQSGTVEMSSLDGLPSLAKANVLAASMLGPEAVPTPSEVGRRIEALAEVFDKVDVENVRAAINEDRAVAGFPEVADPSLVADELKARRSAFKDALRNLLDRLATVSIVETTTGLVERATESGKKAAPALIDDLVDLYEVGAHEFLDAEARNVEILAEAILKAHGAGKSVESLGAAYDRLERVVRNWDFVAQPIQVNYQARGRNHDSSARVARSVRDLSIELFNRHNLLEVSKRLVQLSQEVFAEVPIVFDKLSEDFVTLDGIEKRRATSEQDRQEWEKAIAYEARLGTIFRDPLRISAKGIEWQDELWPLEAITRVRWGGSRGSNGVVNFTIAWGNANRVTSIDTQTASVFEEFTSKLWKAAGYRLYIDLLQRVKSGEGARVGDALAQEFGVELNRHDGPGKVTREFVPWSMVRVYTENGTFNVTKKDEPGHVYAVLSYIGTDNTHVLELAIRNFFKSGKPRLSRLLDE